MNQMKKALLCLVALVGLLAGCTADWKKPVEITLKNNSTLHCTGIDLFNSAKEDENKIICYQSYGKLSVPIKDIALIKFQ